MLRHMLATLAYRGGKATRGASADFASFRVATDTRTPAQILAHIGDLLDWALSLVNGEEAWHNSTPLPWDQEIERFFSALQTLDDRLASSSISAASPEQLFQGPVADAFAHIGQIAMLRRMAGIPIRGENYFKADIVTGRVSANQSPARREFD